MTDCILKLENCTVHNLNIDANNAFKLLDTISSKILESSFVMKYDHHGISQDNLTQNLITLEESSLNIDNIDISDIDSLSTYIVFSKNHSDVIVNRVQGDGDASPSWTDRFASSPTYGNGMSYNVYSGQFIEDTIIFNDNATWSGN